MTVRLEDVVEANVLATVKRFLLIEAPHVFLELRVGEVLLERLHAGDEKPLTGWKHHREVIDEQVYRRWLSHPVARDLVSDREAKIPNHDWHVSHVLVVGGVALLVQVYACQCLVSSGQPVSRAPMPSPSKDVAHFPAVHALDLAEVLRVLGIESAALFDGIVDPNTLSAPEARVEHAVLQRLVVRARELSGQPGIGFLLGLQMRVPAHGYLGFAAMTAPSARHALELAERFAPTRTNALRLKLVEEQGASEASLYIDEVIELGELRETVLIALAVGIWRIGEALTGVALRGAADFTFGPTSYMAEQQGELSVRFNQPRNRLRFDPAYLELPLTMAHASASLLAKEQLERALSEITRSELVTQVRDAIVTAGGTFRDLPEVARVFGVSERTLKRKLQSEGAAFSDVLNDVRREHAEKLLGDPRLSIDEVAERVGYADTSNFTRAFRRWTGKTPAVFRKG